MKPSGWLALLACAAWMSAAPARAEQEPPSSIFGEEIDVRVVNLEVVVTDRQGNRVTDLKPGDFRILVNGKPVSLDFFSEVREGVALSPAQPETLAAEPAPDVAPSVEPGGEVGVNYLVFIDDFFSIARQRNDVLESLKKDLPARLGPQDRMSVVAWDGGRLTRLTDWTASRAAMEKALDAAMARPTRGLQRKAEFQSFISSQSLSGKPPGGDLLAATEGGTAGDRVFDSGLGMLAYSYGEMLARQLGSATSAVSSAMRGSVAPPGRKVLLLLNGSWPFSIQSFISGASGVLISRELPSGEELIRPLTNAANLLGYTIYPVDIPGITSVAADASVNPMEGRGSTLAGTALEKDRLAAGYQDLLSPSFGEGQVTPATFTDTGNLREQELQGSLEFIAKETGGKPMMNSNRMAVLERASADTRSYYWLGFTPAWKGNDQRHSVKVEVLRPGLSARSRASFLDMSRRAEVAMKLESAMLFGGVPGAEAMKIELGAPKRWKKGRNRGLEVPVTLEIPMSAVTVVPVDGRYTVEVELRFAASDKLGNQSNLPVVPVRLSAVRPPGDARVIRYQTKVRLQGEADHLVAAVYDRASGRIAAGETDLTAR